MSNLPRVAADASLAAAIATCEQGAIDAAAEVVLGLDWPLSTAALIVHLDRLSAGHRRQMIDHLSRYHSGLREAATRKGTNGPKHTVQLIAKAADPSLAYLLVEQLRQGEHSVRLAAGQALLQFVARLRMPENNFFGDAGAARFLRAAVSDAVTRYRHHHQPVALDCMAMLAPAVDRGLLDVLNDSRDACVESMRQRIREAALPVIRQSALTWLGVPTLVPSTLGYLSKAVRSQWLPDVFVQGHLLLHAARVAALAKVTQPAGLMPPLASCEAWPAQAQRVLPVWICSLPLSNEERILSLGELTRLPDPAARLSALRKLLRLADEGVLPHLLEDAIAAYAADHEEPIARIATLWLIEALGQAKANRHLVALSGSPHDSVRKLVQPFVAEASFQGLWNGWAKLAVEQRASAASAVAKLDPHAPERLKDRLRSPQPGVCVQAMQMIAALSLADRCVNELVELARSEDRRVAATAVRTLAPVQSQQVPLAIEAALEHEDARVRANAIDAMDDEASVKQNDRLLMMAASDENRPRASAIASLLRRREPSAPMMARTMLADRREKHRISALWLTESMKLFDAATSVAEMAVSDPDPHVRKRAERVVYKLIEQMRKPVAENGNEKVRTGVPSRQGGALDAPTPASALPCRDGAPAFSHTF
ncbi:MAG: HEAT repeat domain-containing protein [Phycisphaeraceae bacterium]